MGPTPFCPICRTPLFPILGTEYYCDELGQKHISRSMLYESSQTPATANVVTSANCPNPKVVVALATLKQGRCPDCGVALEMAPVAWSNEVLYVHPGDEGAGAIHLSRSSLVSTIRRARPGEGGACRQPEWFGEDLLRAWGSRPR